MSESAPAREAVASAAAADVVQRVVANLELAVRAPRDTLELCVLGLLAEGHLIIEDFPGVGKTVLAKSLARSLHLSFSRLQFTPDLLPTDVTGVNVFNQRTNEFEFRPGPVFTNVLLVDEINRASPKTQSALLEAMQECQVTIDGATYQLDLPFLVVATQNPIEYEGTYPLPEAQLDRFTAMLSLGYPPLAEEARMLAEQTTDPPLDHLRPVAEREHVLMAIEAARAVFVEESVNRYVVALLAHTRASPKLALGASPRAGIAVLRMAKARAVVSGRDYVLPDDVQAVAAAVLSHRLIVAPEARAAGVAGADAVREALEHTPGLRYEARRCAAAGLGARSCTGAALAFGSRALGVAGVGLMLAALVTTHLGGAGARSGRRRSFGRSRPGNRGRARRARDRRRARLADAGGLTRRTRLSRTARRLRVPSAGTSP